MNDPEQKANATRRYLIAAAWVGSVVLALLVGILIGERRCQVRLTQRQQVLQAQRDAEAQLQNLMAELRDLRLDAGHPDASTKLISNPRLGDYPPEPPFRSGRPLPKGAPSRDPSSYGPDDRPTGHAP